MDWWKVELKIRDPKSVRFVLELQNFLIRGNIMYDAASWKIEGTVLTVRNGNILRCFTKTGAIADEGAIRTSLNGLIGEEKAGFAIVKLLASVEVKKTTKANEAKEKEKAAAIALLTPAQREMLKKVNVLK